jgi:hypothetical protein
VGLRNRRNTGSANFHTLQDRPTRFILSAHSRTCEDQEFASHKMMSSLLYQHLLEQNLSTLLRKDLKIVCVKGVDQPSSALPRRQGLPPQSRRLAQTGGRSPRTLNLSSTAETPVAPENTCTPLQSTRAIAKIPDSNFMS